MMNTYSLNNNLPLWSFHFKASSKLEVITRKVMETKLIAKALKEPDFKAGLIEDAKKAISDTFGIELPASLFIKVVEETENAICLVLPHNPYFEIAEEELKASLELTYEDVAHWVLGQQRSAFLDDESSIKLIAHAWRDETFKENLCNNAKTIVELEWDIIFPDSLDVVTYEESASLLYLVIPNISNTASLADTENAPDPDIRQALVIGSGAIISTGVSTCVGCGPITCLTGLAGSCTCV